MEQSVGYVHCKEVWLPGPQEEPYIRVVDGSGVYAMKLKDERLAARLRRGEFANQRTLRDRIVRFALANAMTFDDSPHSQGRCYVMASHIVNA